MKKETKEKLKDLWDWYVAPILFFIAVQLIGYAGIMWYIRQQLLGG